MTEYTLSGLWFKDSTKINQIDDIFNGQVIANLCGLLGIVQNVSYDLDANGMFLKRSERGAASGVASLDANQKVVENPQNAQSTFAENKIPIAGANGISASWGSSSFPGSAGVLVGTNSLGRLEHNRTVRINPANGEIWGDLFVGTAGSANIAVGEVLVMKSDNKFYKAKADSNETSILYLGMAASAATNVGDPVTVLRRGVIGLASWPGNPSLAAGFALYLSDATAGVVTHTPPSTSGHFVRIIGHCIYSGTTDVIEFDPSSEWVELA